MVIELRPAGRDKGTAIAEFMGEPPFRGRTPVFLGDDVTDEFGFGVVNGLGGVTVKVGAGPSEARLRLAGVDAVRRVLGRLGAP
jgi:trehalose 6-phosphate phosphatase